MSAMMEVISGGGASSGMDGFGEALAMGGSMPGSSGVLSLEDCRMHAKSIFTSTSCYDLISHSTKNIVFETTIPFQLAFYALIEHGASVAPLWDPARHAFTGLMTIVDYLQALKLCRKENISMLELSARSIADLMSSPKFHFQHSDFSSVDAEDSVHNMCYFLNRHNTNFVPILNPDDSTLVAILGYMDLIHLLDQAAKQHPAVFSSTIREMNLDISGGHGSGARTTTAVLSTPLHSILAYDEDLQGGVPILDEQGIVQGIYHRTDVTFIMKAQESQTVLTNLDTFTIEDVLKLQALQAQTGESSLLTPPLVTCTLDDRIDSVFNVMMQARSALVVIVDLERKFVGMISVREIVRFYLE